MEKFILFRIWFCVIVNLYMPLSPGSAYKYLVLLEANVFQQSEVRSEVTKEYY